MLIIIKKLKDSSNSGGGGNVGNFSTYVFDYKRPLCKRLNIGYLNLRHEFCLKVSTGQF
jgi:hypothetical protein